MLVSHIANKANPHAVTTAQIGAVDLTTNQSIGGAKTFSSGVTIKKLTLSSTDSEAQLAFSRSFPNYLTAPLDGSMNFITNGDTLSSSNSILILSPNGYVGVGKGFPNSTTAITAQLHVRGNILSTGNVTASAGINTPKVDFGNGLQ